MSKSSLNGENDLPRVDNRILRSFSEELADDSSLNLLVEVTLLEDRVQSPLGHACKLTSRKS